MSGMKIAVIACIGLSLASNALFPGIGTASNAHRLPFTPDSPAFAIWRLTYPRLSVDVPKSALRKSTLYGNRAQWDAAPRERPR
jgi:hypothetical protein